jgi:hypothetical protein
LFLIADCRAAACCQRRAAMNLKGPNWFQAFLSERKTQRPTMRRLASNEARAGRALGEDRTNRVQAEDEGSIPFAHSMVQNLFKISLLSCHI